MSDDSRAGSPLTLKPDFEETKRRWEAFWNQEIIDRPCICIRCPAEHRLRSPSPHRCPNEDAEPAERPAYTMEAHADLDDAAAQIDTYVHSIYWGGDAMPHYSPSFGPDQFAGFLGAEIEWSRDQEMRTSWAVPLVERWEDALPLTIEEDNYWWLRMIELMETLAKVAEGKWLVSHIDLHSNMDALVGIRGATPLCLDLYTNTELVAQANDQVRDLYPLVYDTLHYAGAMDRAGAITAWLPAYHEGKCQTTQCDFAALVGPEHFREFILPDLEAEAEHLDRSIYHWDGPDALVHLEALCGIEALDCIQWTPGAGAKPFIEWMDLLVEVQKRGKSLYVGSSVEQLPEFHKHLEPNKVFYNVTAADREELERTLKWLVKNT